jgi:hypothetical protein
MQNVIKSEIQKSHQNRVLLLMHDLNHNLYKFLTYLCRYYIAEFFPIVFT